MGAFIAYTFFALEALSVMIETTLCEMLGDQDLPAAVTPVGYVLL